MRINAWRLTPLLVFGLLVGFFWQGLSLNPQRLPMMQINKQLPFFQIPVLGQPHQQQTSTSLRGQFLLLNVWASWCAACSEEQVFLLELARSGIPIYGINYKDSPTDALKWLSEWGNPFQWVGEDPNGHVSIDLGVYGTPETFLIDPKGIIRYRHAGLLNAAVWKREFVPRMTLREYSPVHEGSSK